jgi:hypothetical protein
MLTHRLYPNGRPGAMISENIAGIPHSMFMYQGRREGPSNHARASSSQIDTAYERGGRGASERRMLGRARAIEPRRARSPPRRSLRSQALTRCGADRIVSSIVTQLVRAGCGY